MSRGGLSRRAATFVAAAVATVVMSSGVALGASRGWLGLDRVHIELRDRPPASCPAPCRVTP